MPYDLRSKTLLVFKEEWERDELRLLADKVLKMPIDEVRKIIWEFTYDPAGAVYRYTWLDMNMNDEKFSTIRAEIVNQYRQVKPTFGYQNYNIPKKHEGEAIKKLRKQANGDGVIMYEVMKRVKVCRINRRNRYMLILFCDKLRDKALSHNALEEMGFNEKEVSFLSSYAGVIADLLEEKKTS